MMSCRCCVWQPKPAQSSWQTWTLSPQEWGFGARWQPSPASHRWWRAKEQNFCPQDYLQHDVVELFLWWQHQHNPVHPNLLQGNPAAGKDQWPWDCQCGATGGSVHAGGWPCGQSLRNTETTILHQPCLNSPLGREQAFQRSKEIMAWTIQKTLPIATGVGNNNL